MKQISKKLISIILCFIIAFSSFSVMSFAAGEAITKIPTVYIQGYGSGIYADSNNSRSKVLFGGSQDFLSDGVLTEILNNITKPLMKGVTSDDWTDYCDLVANTLIADMQRFALDENGEASNGSGNSCHRDRNVVNRNWYGGNYDIFSYTLSYDWRLDPFVTAAELNEYIQKIKAVTGFDKVNIVGRCLGANIVLAYLSEYGYEDINAIQFNMAGLKGFELIGSLFSGDIVIESDLLDKFLQTSITAEEDSILEFVKALVGIMNYTKTLNLPKDMVEKIYSKVYENILPRVLMNSFATLPAFWSFVGDGYYEKAKELNFPTIEEQTKYAKLIEKTDRYHYDVLMKTPDIINSCIDAGIPVYIFAKYGFAAVPIYREAKYQNDKTVSVQSQTIGATTSNVGEVFNRDYLKQAEEKGTINYISADRCIDASTCMLPEHTWFIKGVEHKYKPLCIDVMMAAIFNYTGNGEKYVTVNDYPEYPQFNVVEKNGDFLTPMHPMTAENGGDDENLNVPFINHFSVFFKHTSKIFLFFMDTLFNFINSLLNAVTTN